MPIHIAFADDHTLVREGFRGIVQLHQDFEIDFECGTSSEAIALLEDFPDLDVFIVDISLADETGFELISHANDKGVKCLVVSMHAKEPYISQAMRLGAHGYISKASAASQLLRGIKEVNDGGIYYSPDIKAYLAALDGVNPITRLTSRELEICIELVKGLEIKKIASKLKISPKTVYVHKSNAFEKLNITSNENLFNLAREFGLEVMGSYPLNPAYPTLTP